MQFLKCGNKYINLSQVTYVEWLDGVEVFVVHFAVYKPSVGTEDMDETDYRIYLEAPEEHDAMTDWLNEHTDS